MAQSFDLVILGTGSAALSVAYPCRSAGRTVAIVDSRPFGGTCALRGCDPKKVLVGAADVIDWLRRMEGKGISSTDVKTDWSALMRFKKTFTDPVPEDRQKKYAEAGIATFHGRTHFLDRTKVRVGGDTLSGRFILIA